MKIVNKILAESSLSRVWNHIEKYDCAMLTAFRGKEENCLYSNKGSLAEKDVSDYGLTADRKINVDVAEPKVYTKAENLARNKELKAALLKLGYGVTAIDGSYIENYGSPDSREVAENSFFVVNLKNDSNFFEHIISLGKTYCQDSVFLKPQGQPGVLYGTNNADFPGLDQKIEIGQFKGGKDAEFFSRVKKRAFTFESYDSYDRGGKWAITKLAESVINRINDQNKKK